MYGIDGLSFEYNNNPDKTIKAEETKMCEKRDMAEKNEQMLMLNKLRIIKQQRKNQKYQKKKLKKKKKK